MEHIESQLHVLQDTLVTMTHMVKIQVQKSKQALFQGDLELAAEVIQHDKRVNDLELQIDKDCKNILALYSPVAIDLRFILAALKISLNLERIGDNAEGVCHIVKGIQRESYTDLLVEFRLDRMFDKAIRMLDNILKAIEEKDTKVASKTFKKDNFLNKANQMATDTAVRLIHERPDITREILHLLHIVRKVERMGDLAKNISEEIIFHIEAKVIKHADKKKK